MARGSPRFIARCVVEDREGQDELGVDHLRAGNRGGSCVGMDRRPERQARRRLVAPALHAAQGQEPVVENQPREGRGADRRRLHAAAWSCRGRARKVRRTVGARIRRSGLLECARRSGRRVRPKRSSARLLRDARRRKPLRDPVPCTDGEEAGDASRAHHALRRHMRTTRDDPCETSDEGHRLCDYDEVLSQEVGEHRATSEAQRRGHVRMRRDRGRGATRARRELRSKVSRARPEPDCVAWTARRFGSPSRRAIERTTGEGATARCRARLPQPRHCSRRGRVHPEVHVGWDRRWPEYAVVTARATHPNHHISVCYCVNRLGFGSRHLRCRAVAFPSWVVQCSADLDGASAARSDAVPGLACAGE